MKPMLMRELAGAEPGMLLGVDHGAGVRQMVELIEPFQPERFSDEVHWKARVWRSGREVGPKYDGAIVRIRPETRILVPSKQR